MMKNFTSDTIVLMMSGTGEMLIWLYKPDLLHRSWASVRSTQYSYSLSKHFISLKPLRYDLVTLID